MLKQYPPEDIKTFKKNPNQLTYDQYKNMDRTQQAELYAHYEKAMTIKTLADLWNIKPTTLHTLKYKLKKDGFLSGDARINQPKKKQKPKQTPPPKEEVKEEQTALNLQRIETPVILSEVARDEIQTLLENQAYLLQKMEDMTKESTAHTSGFHYQMNGTYPAEDIMNRLKKILLLLEDETEHYTIHLEIRETPTEKAPETIEDESETLTEDDVKEIIKDEHTTLTERIEELEQALAKQKDLEQYLATSYKEASQTVHESTSPEEANEKGRNYPRQTNASNYTGIIMKNGKTLYQVFYICPGCNHKAKHFIENGRIYVNCHNCGKRLRTRSAVKDQVLVPDAFSNYFIAGKFKRKDEVEQEKSLFEIWKD